MSKTIKDLINEKFNKAEANAKAIRDLLNRKGYGMMGDAADRLADAGEHEAITKADNAQIIPGIEIWETKPADAVSYLRKINDCDNISDDDRKDIAKDEYMHVMTIADLKARGAMPFDGIWVYSDKIVNEIKRRKAKLRDDYRAMAEDLISKTEDDREQWLLFAEYNDEVMANQEGRRLPYRLDFTPYLSDAKKERLEKVKNFVRETARTRGCTEIVIAIDEAFSGFLDFYGDETEEDCSTVIMWYSGEINGDTIKAGVATSLINTDIMTEEEVAEEEEENDDYNGYDSDDNYGSDDGYDYDDEDFDDVYDEDTWTDCNIN